LCVSFKPLLTAAAFEQHAESAVAGCQNFEKSFGALGVLAEARATGGFRRLATAVARAEIEKNR